MKATLLRRWRRARAGRLPPLAAAVLLAPLVLMLATTFLSPLVRLLSLSLWNPDFTLTQYQRLFAEPLYLTILARTLRVAVVVSFLTLALGYPVALLMARLKGWRAAVVAACVLVPLWTSVLVRSYAWVVLLQRNGLINASLLSLGLIGQPLRMIYTEGAVVLAMTHVLLPFMVLPIFSVVRNIPVDLVRAAANLGAGGFASFRYVVMPLSLPGVFSGALMVFILSLGFYITPALVGGPRTLMIATLIGQQMTELLNWAFASALAVVLVTLTFALVAAVRRTLKLDRVVGHGA